MPKSMTGFGSSAGEVGGVSFSVEIRCVNHRSMKFQSRISEPLKSKATTFENAIRERIHRGSVSYRIEMALPRDNYANSLDIDVLKGYVDRLSTLIDSDNDKLVLDVASIVGLPGVIVEQKTAIDDEMFDCVAELVEEAIDGVLDMREVEGQQVVKHLESLASNVSDALGFISERADAATDWCNTKLRKRVAELSGLSEIEIDGDSLAREVAILAEKSDIAEEIERLKSHLIQFRQTLLMDEPVGRKLDFLAQEMLREANTIGSKTQDSEVSTSVVDIKTAIDRVKEQAANLE